MMAKAKKPVTLESIQRQVRVGLAGVSLAIASLVGAYFLRSADLAHERADRRETVCDAQEALAEASLDALVVVFAPKNPTPEQAVQIEQAKADYWAEVGPALEGCGQLAP